MSKKNETTAENLLDVHEAAEMLGVNPGTIRRWAQSNTISGLKVGVRGDWRFTKDYILKMTKSNGADNEQVVAPDWSWHKMHKSEHFVQFYENDAYLLKSLTKYITKGIQEGETCIVIATPTHRESLYQNLTAEGIESSQLQRQLTLLDAAETLSTFIKDGVPNRAKFNKVIGGLISKATNKGYVVRAYGEMVALLWAGGNHAGAIQLERLWNDLGKRYTFSLFCAYPMQDFGNGDHGESFTQIGIEHSHSIPAESYAGLTKTDDRLREITLLQQKATALEAEVEKRKQLEKQKDEFIAIASHELKTPVTSMKGFTQLLHRRFKKQGDEQSAQLLSKMDSQVNKLTGLITDLLDVTKMDGGKLQFRESVFNLNKVIENAVEEVQLTTDKHKIITQLSSDISIFGDKDRIGQVLMNLLTNAVKYSPDTNKILVKTSLNNGEATISVQDFGLGIPKDQQEKVFDRFFRVGGNGRETYPGIGLGLYIASEIVKRHGGRICVQSKEDKGSTFSFMLPVHTE